MAYESVDDVTGITARTLLISDGDLVLSGRSLTLGAGGLTDLNASPASLGPDLSRLPVTLGADQTWSIDGGHGAASSLVGDLEVGVVSGRTHKLAIRLRNGVGLNVGSVGGGGGGNDIEVGPLSITGANATHTGMNADLNGAVSLLPRNAPGSDIYHPRPDLPAGLNAATAMPVTLTNAALSGNGNVGPLRSVGGMVQVGDGEGLGFLNVNGGVTLDAASVLQLSLANPGSAAGRDYAQLRASANIDLADAHLKFERPVAGGASNACDPLHPGDVAVLVTTTGSLIGRFAGVPDGAVIRLDSECLSPSGVARINYTAHTVTGTVLTDTTPSLAQIEALLLAQITPKATAGSIANLLKMGGSTLPFNSPTDGSVTVGWFYSAASSHYGVAAHTPLAVAVGRLTFSAAGTGQLRMKLTAPGKRLLKRATHDHAKRLQLFAVAVFKPTGDPAAAVLAEKPFRLSFP